LLNQLRQAYLTATGSATDSLPDRELYEHRQNKHEDANVINDSLMAGFLPQLEEKIKNYRKTQP